MTAPSPGRGRSLARAALLGLSLAGLVAGAASECELEREVAATVGRTPWK
jgi:hypothetical protein